jgi:hypothetical protein
MIQFLFSLVLGLSFGRYTRLFLIELFKIFVKFRNHQWQNLDVKRRIRPPSFSLRHRFVGYLVAPFLHIMFNLQQTRLLNLKRDISFN